MILISPKNILQEWIAKEYRCFLLSVERCKNDLILAQISLFLWNYAKFQRAIERQQHNSLIFFYAKKSFEEGETLKQIATKVADFQIMETVNNFVKAIELYYLCYVQQYLEQFVQD